MSMEAHYIIIRSLTFQPVEIDTFLFHESDTTTALLEHVYQKRPRSGRRYSSPECRQVRYCGPLVPEAKSN